jgi:hypothetical protein
LLPLLLYLPLFDRGSRTRELRPRRRERPLPVRDLGAEPRRLGRRGIGEPLADQLLHFFIQSVHPAEAPANRL